MTDFKPANSKEFQEYFQTEEDAKDVRKQLAANHPETEYVIVRTNKDPNYPYEIYYRSDKAAKRDRLQLLKARMKR